MHIKVDTEDEKYSRFLKSYELQNLVRKYSDYIRYPIKMDVEKSRVKEETKDAEKPEYETYTENETLNSMVPIWQRNKKDVKDEEYNQFYKEKFFDYEDPTAVIHADVEGAVTYKALLYIPSKAPYDFYTKEFKKGLQLYSSGVMIMNLSFRRWPTLSRRSCSIPSWKTACSARTRRRARSGTWPTRSNPALTTNAAMPFPSC